MDKNMPAFPSANDVMIDEQTGTSGHAGMTLRDYFAIRAPILDEQVETERAQDRYKNPHNESHKPKIRSELEIRASLSYKYADAMLKAREE